MARLTDNAKELILADYHTNKYSQRDLAKKHNVSVGTISKLTKEIEPLNEHLVNAQTSIIRANEELNSEQMNAVMNTSHDIVRRENLVYGASEKIVKLAQDMATSNKKQVVVKVKEYSKENGSSESLDMMELELDASDLKNLADTVDKSAITLKVAERHAPRQVTAIQVNNEDKEVKTGVGELYKAINE